jgi:hypothetical protein
MSGVTLPGAGRETADAGAGVGTERTAYDILDGSDRIGRYRRGGGDAFRVRRRRGGEFQRIRLDSIRFETLLGWG